MEILHMIRRLLVIGLIVLVAPVWIVGCNEAKVEHPKVQGTAPTVPVIKASGGGADMKAQSE
jgi:hypothetical protein